VFDPDYLPITRRHRTNRLGSRTRVIGIAIRYMHRQGRWTICWSTKLRIEALATENASNLTSDVK